MIEAKHSFWAKSIFDVYINRQFKKCFSHFYLVNLPERCSSLDSNSEKDSAIVLAPNHFSYWDGFLIYKIYKSLFPSKKFYILMLEKQLRRYWFFNYLGAFSIEPSNPKSIIATIRYMEALLNSPSSFIAFYPQGEYQDLYSELFTLKQGLVKFMQKSDAKCCVLPVGFMIRAAEEKFPFIACRFGKPFTPSAVSTSFSDFSYEFNSNYSMLKEATSYGKSFDSFKDIL